MKGGEFIKVVNGKLQEEKMKEWNGVTKIFRQRLKAGFDFRESCLCFIVNIFKNEEER